MEYALLAVIFLLVLVIIFLIFRMRKAPATDIDQLAEKLRFALASADSVREIQRILESLPRDVLKSITSSEAVRAGKFHIWPVGTIDEGIEVLTCVPAGERGEDGGFPENTVHGCVDRRLHELAEKMIKFGQDSAPGKKEDGEHCGGCEHGA